MAPASAGRSQISGEAAVLIAWLILGIADVATLAYVARGSAPVQNRLGHCFFDLGYFLACGLVGYALVWAWKRWGPQFRLADLAGITALALAVASVTLTTDLEHMSHRLSGRFSAGLILAASVTGVAMGIPVAAATGHILRRLELRAVGVGAGVIGQIANHFFLKADYPGAHLFWGGACVTLVATSIAGTRWPTVLDPVRTRLSSPAVRLAVIAVLVAAGAGSILVRPSPLVAALLQRYSGSFLPPYVSRVHSRTSHVGDIDKNADPQWFRQRAGMPAIPPGPALVGKDAIIVLIGVDALRADLVNSGQYDQVLPALARLRSESVVFTNARANGSQTVYSLATLFAGTHFSQQYWTKRRAKGKSLLPHADPTPRFPAQLTNAGVLTINYSGARWMRNDWGIVAGFGEEHWVKDPGHRYSRAHVVAAALAEGLRTVGPEPTFMFTHFLDPHAPYNLSEREGSSFERYLGECALADEEIGKLLNIIDSDQGLESRTTVIVIADHGEAFGEHNSIRHATTLYDELLRVPLLVRVPDVAARVVDTPVSLVDLGPTILDLYEQPTPAHIIGQTLVPFLRGEPYQPTRPFIAEGRLKRAMILQDGTKIIEDTRQNVLELYDLNTDPGEAHNLVNDAERLETPLNTLLRFFEVHRIRRPGYEIPYRP